MVIYGTRTSAYIQAPLVVKIDKFVRAHKDIFKSRSHFINAAVVRQLRFFCVDADEKETL